MRLLTWIPGELREHLAALDPALDATPAVPPDFDQIVRDNERGHARVDAVSGPYDRRPGRHNARRWLAAVCASALVVAVAGSIAFYNGRRAPDQSASTGSSPIGAALSGATTKWATFPIGATPRPIVLLSSAIAAPAHGFPDDATKTAYNEGRFQLATSLPTNPSSVNGYPILPAADALNQLQTPHRGPATTTTLQILDVHLGTHQFQTDRGPQSLPSWEIKLGAVSDDVNILAIAASSRFPTTLSNPNAEDFAGQATLSHDGRTLSIPFVASHVATGPCDIGYTNTLSVQQTPTAIVLTIKRHTDSRSDAASANSSPIACTEQGVTPGTPHPIPLDAPLGSRVVTAANGSPYQVITR